MKDIVSANSYYYTQHTRLPVIYTGRQSYVCQGYKKNAQRCSSPCNLSHYCVHHKDQIPAVSLK